jgi:predicted ribosome quality control (RQC) complex YloA/Tae2 family protein
LARGLARAIARVERRIRAVKTDLDNAEAARTAAERARLFVSHAASAPRGTRRLSAVDWSSGDPQTVEWAVDPAKTASEQLNAIFHRARRLAGGAALARDRLRSAETTLEKLRELASEANGPEVDVENLDARALEIAPRDYSRALRAAATPKGRRVEAAPRPPYRKFIGAGRRPILVGRDAARNDQLTLEVARPRDLWMHARNWAGAHVIVPLDKGASCPPDLLVQAAHLAAHFSDARGESVVEVTYAPRRYVRKPRGSAPGAVVVDREKVLVLRKEDAALRKLLESEVEV